MKVVQPKSSLGKIEVGLFELHSECIPRSFSERSVDPDPSLWKPSGNPFSAGLQGPLISITNNL